MHNHGKASAKRASSPRTRGSHEPGRPWYSISRRKSLQVRTCERGALALSRRAGRGKIDHPGGSRKACLFFGASVKTSKDADCWDETTLVLSSSISFKVNLSSLM